MEQGTRDKTGLCGVNIHVHTLSCWILNFYKLFFAQIETIGRIEDSSEAEVEERKRYAK